jgi:DNA-binding PadR family transcriptional regulator
MSLPHAILGFLQYGPMTGYDLKTEAFDRTVAHFWPAVQQQIYRELEKMEATGWVASSVEVQTSKPNRRVYAISAAGRSEFAHWLNVQQPPPPHREAFLIRLFFAAQLSNDEIVALLEGQRAAHRERLAELEEVERGFRATPSPPRAHACMGFTLDFGLRLERLYIDWLGDCIRATQALNEGTASVRHRQRKPRAT